MSKVNFTSAQHVKIEFEIASVFLRIAAYVLDTIILFVYMFIATMSIGLSLFDNSNLTLFFLLLLIKLPWILYQPLMEYLTAGQTLGKMIVGIRVLKINGERPGMKEIMVRWLFRGDFLWISTNFFVFFIPFWNVIDTFITGLSIYNQRLGDAMAGTIIVKNKSSVQYSLADVLRIKTNENFTPTYPGVAKFTDEDMIYLKNCLQHRRLHKGKKIDELLLKIADECAVKIGLEETPKERIQFMETLLNDYVVLTR